MSVLTSTITHRLACRGHLRTLHSHPKQRADRFDRSEGPKTLTRQLTYNSDFQGEVAALQAGKLNNAERPFKSVLRAEPEHVGALNRMGVVLTPSKRFAEAENYFRRALQQQEQSDATFYNYDIVLKALKRPAEAVQRFSEALKINSSVAARNRDTYPLFDTARLHAPHRGRLHDDVGTPSREGSGPEAFAVKPIT